jgi:raffinose/stachyose/melibiose transport system substrate-binding protein
MPFNQNRVIYVLTLAAVLALLLAGCPAPPAAAPAGGAQSSAAQPASTEKIKLTWWTEAPEDQYRKLIQEQFVDTFNKAHPDMQLEILFQEKLDDTLRTAIQAGAAPDIIQTPGPSFVLEYVNAGFIAPLDDAAQQFGWKDKLLPWAYDSGTLQGKLYSLPLTYETMVLYYNKALFKEKGWSPPTSREDIEKLCQAADKEKLVCFSDSNQYWKGVNEWIMSVLYTDFSGADNVYKALQGQKPWTDDEFLGATKLVKDWMDKGWFSGSRDNYFALSHEDIWNAMCQKKALMNIEGTWAFQDAPRFCKDDWDWVALPALRPGVTPGFTLAIGSTVSVNAKSKHPEAAAAVLDWIVNDKGRAAKIIEGFNFGEWNVPLHFTAQDFSSGVDERFIRYVETFAKDTGAGNFGYTTWTFWPAKTDQYIIKELDSVLTGDITPEQYQEEQQKQFTDEKTAGKVPPSPPTKIETKK